MEKLNSLRNETMRLPPGFRFHPTDEELVVHYLKRKVFNCSLPTSIILEVDVCKSDPWDLPGDSDQERYFFSTREVKYGNGNRCNRATGSGYWKATGIDKQIAISRGQQLVGMKKTLVFYNGKPPHGCRTDWIMHEYRLASAQTTAAAPQGNWVLCRIFLKKRGSKNDEKSRSRAASKNDEKSRSGATTLRNTRLAFYDFLASERTDLNVPPASSSSSRSSEVTEVSCNHQTDNQEEASSSTSFRRNR